MKKKPTTKTKYTQVKYNKDGTVKKSGTISKKKFNRKSDRYSKQTGSKSLGTNTSKVQQVVAGGKRRKSVSRKVVKAAAVGAAAGARAGARVGAGARAAKPKKKQ
tara:strand:+ start:2354 stop:2668 length:315 start_codon:yes stop_codon:yes gene_type:complete